MVTSADADRRLHDEVAVRLAALDQRYTGNRRVLVDVLADADRPVNMGEILAAAGRLPQSSAYRNLTVLIDAGVVRRVPLRVATALAARGVPVVVHGRTAAPASASA